MPHLGYQLIDNHIQITDRIINTTAVSYRLNGLLTPHTIINSVIYTLSCSTCPQILDNVCNPRNVLHGKLNSILLSVDTVKNMLQRRDREKRQLHLTKCTVFTCAPRACNCNCNTGSGAWIQHQVYIGS